MRNNLILTVGLAIGSISVTGLGKIQNAYQVYFVSNAPAQTDQFAHGEYEQHQTQMPSGAEHHPIGSHEPRGHESAEQHSAKHADGEHHAQHKITVTSPVAEDVTLTQQYVCQIHSRRHIELCALVGGYLKQINVGEGQSVKKGEKLFHILPTMYEAKLEADTAEAQLARVEYDNTLRLVQKNIVSPQELKLAKAKLDKSLANLKLAQAEMDFANIKAPFDGIVDRLHEQEGSLIEEGTMLTTMSDNSVMWVYFNVPEARYLEYQTAMNNGQSTNALNLQLKLANHTIFDQPGEIGAIEADFDSETGNIAFRANFPNPKGLLRHGQTGTVLIHSVVQDAIVIPQRATFEILAKKYVYVVDAENVVHQREIEIRNEKDDIFLITEGLHAGERIVLEGIRQVRDGDTIEYEFEDPATVLANLKYHAE
ncbi:efflux RND transporter periplasmic adaptor subunit [Rhodopirellula sp. SWK7]|uniref:efflux RND transporter periplasmic adaptor subunit n=1 Tax=Rhodopirellula sp. SWK7 TaxID=595460 RepID=UPI0002BF41D9|nr:efflux RND transporter periplasmic adaptor subunit [Rhodopirellula sp. SWK7]EMI47397.1 efflux transporter, RND family, MFP subunit [Rhodopirellula sp. SWK7]